MTVEVTFGQVVKTHRRELGLTQEELARRVGCAPVTLRKIEYDDLRPSVQIAAGLISATLANDLPGPGTVYLSQTLQFKAPVYPDDTITATVEVKNVRPDDPIVTLSTVCKNQNDRIVLEGEAVVLISG